MKNIVTGTPGIEYNLTHLDQIHCNFKPWLQARVKPVSMLNIAARLKIDCSRMKEVYADTIHEFSNAENTVLCVQRRVNFIRNYWKKISIFDELIDGDELYNFAYFTNELEFRKDISITSEIGKVKVPRIQYRGDRIPRFITVMSDEFQVHHLKEFPYRWFIDKRIYFESRVSEEILDQACYVVNGLYVSKDNLRFDTHNIGRITDTNIPRLKKRVYNTYWKPHFRHWPQVLENLIREYIGLVK